MTTIEDKLKLFKDVVFEKVQKEKQKDVEQFEALKADRINSLVEELNLKEKVMISETSKKANSKAQEIIAKEKLSRQHAILNLKEQMLEEIIEALAEKLADYTDTEDYAKVLINSFEEDVKNLQEGDYCVFLTKKDSQKHLDSLKKIGCEFKNGKIEFKVSISDIIGGTIIEDATGRMRIDNSLKAKLNDSKEHVGLKVTEGLS